MSWHGSAHKSYAPQLKPHDHVAFLCGRPDHWRDLVAFFMREGLDDNQRCLYLHGLYQPPQVYALLVHEGLPVGDARLDGRLAMEPATEYFLTDGCLDAKATLAKLSAEVVKTIAAGCSGLRLLVDMNWATYLSGGMAGLLECERLLNDLFLPLHPCLAVCHYERVLFSPQALKRVSDNHGAMIEGGQLRSPVAAAGRAASPGPAAKARPWAPRDKGARLAGALL